MPKVGYSPKVTKKVAKKVPTKQLVTKKVPMKKAPMKKLAVKKAPRQGAVPDFYTQRVASALVCKACLGSGRSTSGITCFPCRGSGLDLSTKVWVCPDCGTEHVGFIRNDCRNEECSSKD